MPHLRRKGYTEKTHSGQHYPTTQYNTFSCTGNLLTERLKIYLYYIQHKWQTESIIT